MEAVVGLALAAAVYVVIRSFKASRAEAQAAKMRLDAEIAARALLGRHEFQDRRFGLREEANAAEAVPFAAPVSAPATERIEQLTFE